MNFLASIAPLAARYDAFILDLWGVIHDGQQLYPKVKECLQALRKHNKKRLFLSNAPRRASVAREALERMGITPELYDAIITSGETAYQAFANPESSSFKPRGKRYFYIGLEKDRSLLSGLHYEEVDNPEFAQFVLLAHSYSDNQPMKEIMPLLEHCRAHNLPVVCVNPDSEVVRQNGERVYCAGEIAHAYHMMGGEVVYFGKPHTAVYEACLGALGATPKRRIVAVGDNLLTDVKGAQRYGIASALVTGGILHDAVGAPGNAAYEAACKDVCKQVEVMPAYVVPAFNW